VAWQAIRSPRGWTAHRFPQTAQDVRDLLLKDTHAINVKTAAVMYQTLDGSGTIAMLSNCATM
jgi:hypothetical protein